jgi:hypothetical protein
MPDISAAEKAQRRLKILGALPAEQIDVARRTGLSVATISRWIRRLHVEGDIHIGSWRRHPSGGDPIPTYVAGPGSDAPCTVVPLGNTERCRRARLRKRERAKIAAIEAQEVAAAATWAGVWGRLVRDGAGASSYTQDEESRTCLETF